MSISRENFGLYLLRFGLVVMYIYFGISQLQDPVSWSGIVPSWAISISTLDAVTIVYANAVFEIVFAILLVLGFCVRWVSYILGMHLAVITVTLGLTPEGVRDFVITLATFTHGLLDKGKTKHFR